MYVGHKPEDAQQPAASEPLSVADSLNALLVQQVQAAREAEQQRAVEEILYLWCLHKLAEGDMTVTMSFAGDSTFDEQVQSLTLMCCELRNFCDVAKLWHTVFTGSSKVCLQPCQ